MFKRLRQTLRRGKDGTAPVEVGQPEFDPQRFDPFAADFIANPYPVLAQLRQHDPFRAANGNWIISRYHDVSRCLANPQLSNTPSPYAVVHQRNRERYSCADIANRILPYLDAPEHTGPRKSIAFHFHASWQIAEQAIDTRSQAHFAALAARQQGDLLREFATPLCVEAIFEVLGLVRPDEVLIKQIKTWSMWFFYLFSIIPSEEHRLELDRQLDAFRQFCREQIASGQASGGLIEQLQSPPDILSKEQLAENCMLLIADAANADYGIANALRLVLSDCTLRQELNAPDVNLNRVADELMRFDSPSLFIARRALTDLTLGGQKIAANSGVMLMLAAANRDDSVFPEPDALNFQRERNPYLSFGRGEHSCIGRKLVRKLVASSLQAVLDCPREITFRGDPAWDLRAGHRWLKSLDVDFR